MITKRIIFTFGSILLFGVCLFLFFWIHGFWTPFVPVSHVSISSGSSAHIFLEQAKKQIGVVKTYDFSNGYYSNGGFPPDDTGVCSDVIWRAYRDMGIDFKKIFQADVHRFPASYGGDMDSNINFRRVKRLHVYFSRTSQILSNELIPNNAGNLATWQPGDIVIFEVLPANHLWHIGIIADTRRADGVPYMLDNHGNGVGISITPLEWPTKIIGHFRPFS